MDPFEGDPADLPEIPDDARHKPSQNQHRRKKDPAGEVIQPDANGIIGSLPAEEEFRRSRTAQRERGQDQGGLSE